MEIKRITKDNPEFPKGLKKAGTLQELYYMGDISLVSKQNTIIALIGRRDATKDVAKIARRCGEIFAECGVVTLNGLAVGCDTEGLKGALAAGGKCIVVMPCGLDYIYPKCNDALAKQILDNGGCLVSEYPPGTRPEKWKFVARDKIQAQLSNKVLVVDCEEKSGTMYAVKEGVRLKKDLGCIVRAKADKLSSGNQYILDELGAKRIIGENTLKKFAKENKNG